MFQALLGLKVARRIVTKSALSQARNKVSFEAFIELNRRMNRFFYRHFPIRRWFGFRLLAVDGSTVLLPSDTETRRLFSVVSKAKNEKKRVKRSSKRRQSPMLRISQLFDVLNDITVDAFCGFYDWSERDIAVSHAERVGKRDLILLDRGYPAFWLFSLLRSKKARFCARAPISWKAVKAFVQSGKKEQWVFLQPTPTSKRMCRNLDLPENPLRVRLVRVELSSGEVEVLITDLLDENQFPVEAFAELYAFRWPVEEDYKRLKSRLDIGNLSGKSLQSVLQDFHAKVFAKNLTSILAGPAKKEIKNRSAHKKYEYQLNFTQACRRMKDTVIMLFQDKHPVTLLKSLFDIFVKMIEPLRPGRKVPRNHKKPKPSAYAYQSGR